MAATTLPPPFHRAHPSHPSHLSDARTSSLAELEPSGALSTLVYRSRASSPMNARALAALLVAARARNHALSVTGLLIYDRGTFFQWIEGPSAAIAALWQSIRHDPRHHHVECLGEHRIPVRLFGEWDMRLAHRESTGATADSASMIAPDATLDQLHELNPVDALNALDRLHQPARLVSEFWAGMASLADAALAKAATGDHTAQHATVTVNAASDFSALESLDPISALTTSLVSHDAGLAGRFVQQLIDHGLSAESICLDLLEPAARRLGDLWSQDRCTGADVTTAMASLLSLTRRLGQSFKYKPQLPGSAPAVLVATPPGEPHMLGFGLASEFFWQAGWRVACDFPSADSALATLVRGRWFDVLDLTASSVFRRDERLNALAKTIHEARAASLNPRLMVLVSGRIFFEQPEAGIRVGADSAYTRVGQLIGRAEGLMRANLSPGYVSANAVLRDLANPGTTANSGAKSDAEMQ